MSKEAIFIQDGKAIDITAGSNGISAGVVVISGEIIGVAKNDIPANSVGAIALDGIYDVAKASADSFSVGAAVYFNATSRFATSTSSGNTKIGKAVAAAVSGGASVKVKIG